MRQPTRKQRQQAFLATYLELSVPRHETGRQAFKRTEPEHVSVSCSGANWDGVVRVSMGGDSEGTLDRGLPGGHGDKDTGQASIVRPS